ncbi:MAG: tRNA (adenosine(37)-N6)-threonylcarbamoyltransferase complex dimerization subunit type 1 TsaB [Actinomycetota bacterium]
MTGEKAWLLAWDLSAPRGVLALDGPGTTLRHEIAGAMRVSRLFVVAGELLAEAGIAKDALGLLGVGCGPGSFTGVRVAVTAAKVLAAALHVPLVAPDSLMVLAAGAGETGGGGEEGRYVFAAIDARRGEVYHALYRVEGGRPHVLMEPSVATPESAAASLLSWMEGEGHAVIGTGSGIEAYRTAWPREMRPVGGRHPCAEGLVGMCRLARDRGEDADPMTLLPFYLRRPDTRERCGDEARGGNC